MRLALQLAAAVCAVASSGLPHAQQEPAPTFRAGIDLLTVEATILDAAGRPIPDLQPADFSVKVAGKPRTVLFARFNGSTVSAGATPSMPPAAGVTTAPANAPGVPGHIVVFVVDRESIRSGSEKALLESAGAVIDSLSPADAVALIGIPGPAVALTREHERVARAIESATGTRPQQPMARDRSITWEEALAFEANARLDAGIQRDQRVIKEVIERECDPREQQCFVQLMNQARELLATGRAHLQTVTNTLTRLADQLAPLRGSKHVVMLSGGLPFGQDLLPYFGTFAKKAAAAHLVFYAIHLDQPGTDSSDRTKTIASAFGGRDMASGLTTLAGLTGGAYFHGVARATGVFDRIRVEMNNFYELGIEALPEDSAGKPRDIEVKVNRPGLSVRTQRQVTLLDSAAAAARRTNPIETLLAQPTDLAELPISVTAYTTRGDEPSTLRVLISTGIGGAQAKAPVDWGFLVLKEGNPVANGRSRISTNEPGPWAVTTSARLTPGEYRLRFVAADADQRAGVADIPLTVGLRAAGPLQVSDLIVGTADGGRLQPRAQMDRGAPASALIELYSNDPVQLEKTTAVLEIIPAGTAGPVQRYLMARRSSPISGAILVAEGDFTTATLTPGKYTASVVALLDNQPVGRVSRAFELK